MNKNPMNENSINENQKNDKAITPELTPTSSQRLTKAVVQALILMLPLVAGIIVYRIWFAQPSVAPESEAAIVRSTISAQTLEERFGIRVTLIAVTAGGGIVDFRYKVVDKDKAAFIVGEPENAPSLVSEQTGITIPPPNHTMKHNAELENGASYFIFYPNIRNAVRPGMPVSVAIGATQVEPIIAQ